VLAGDTAAGKGSSLRLVPQYDAYVIGSRPRERVMTEAARARIRSFRRGVFEGAVALQVVLLDGRIVGLWERKGGRVRVEAFERLPKRALRAEADRLEGELELATLA
jgi:Winged helix DNA-binding domain